MNGKKHTKSAKRSYYGKKGAKKTKTLFGAKAQSVGNYQVLNKISKTYHFKESFDPEFSITSGTGNPVATLSKFKIAFLPRYSNIVSMFRQIRINSITYRFTLLTTELSDNTILPTMYIRYNYDPTLIVGALGEDQMERISNVVKKTFSHNTPQGRSFNYVLKPAVMGAIQLFSTTNYMPSPIFNKYFDTDPSGTTDEAELYGLQWYIPNLAVGQQIQCTAEVSYTCKDLV